MTVKFLPIRKDILNTFKNFPWASATQTETLVTSVDHLLAGRGKGRKALLRSGMTPLTDRKLQYNLNSSLCYLRNLKEQQQKGNNKIDHRRIYQIALDDTIKHRVGKGVFASSYQYNHSKSSVEWGQTIVDMVLVSDHVFEVDYQVYLPNSYLSRTKQPEDEFKTKITLAQQLFQRQYEQLIAQKVSTKKIWVSIDCWYPSEELVTSFKQKEVKIAMGLKKDTRCNLFGKFFRLDETFDKKSPWKYRTNRRSCNNVYFQEKTLNLTCQGRCKVFAVRRGNDKRIRYYGTNDLKISFDRFLARLTTHWQVETMHHNIKQFFGFNKCMTGSKVLNQLHWSLCYFSYKLFRDYQWKMSQKNILVTIPHLFALYCYQYDEDRAYKCFSSPLKRSISRRRLIAGLC